MQVTLAEALLRRKELAAKVEQLRTINVRDCFEVKVQRKKASDDLDDIIAQVPKLTAEQVTAEHDHYSRALRRVDAMIQRANWSVQIDVHDIDMMAWGEARAAAAKVPPPSITRPPEDREGVITKN